MFKKTITYTDYNGLERTEDYYFNITASELMDLELKHDGGFSAYLEAIVNAKDTSKLKAAFDDILKLSYGVKSEDGRRFIKRDELFDEFKESPAYDQMMFELYTNDKFSAEFANGILPKLTDAQRKKLEIVHDKTE